MNVMKYNRFLDLTLMNYMYKQQWNIVYVLMKGSRTNSQFATGPAQFSVKLMADNWYQQHI